MSIYEEDDEDLVMDTENKYILKSQIYCEGRLLYPRESTQIEGGLIS